ncbi:MAG: ankyrin repeat domain-containing protein [bacterium]
MMLPLVLVACSEPDQPSISLYLAIQRGDIDQVERHIHWGTDINQLDPDGKRAIHVASAQGRQILVRLLLENGADIDLTDKQGLSAIYYAVLNGRTQLTELLLRRGAAFDPDRILLGVSEANTSDRDVIHILVQHGANLEVRNTEGQTPLLIAIGHGNHRLVRHLVAQGADVNVRNAENISALQIAKQRDLEDIAHLLKSNGATQE